MSPKREQQVTQRSLKSDRMVARKVTHPKSHPKKATWESYCLFFCEIVKWLWWVRVGCAPSYLSVVVCPWWLWFCSFSEDVWCVFFGGGGSGSGLLPRLSVMGGPLLAVILLLFFLNVLMTGRVKVESDISPLCGVCVCTPGGCDFASFLMCWVFGW